MQCKLDKNEVGRLHDVAPVGAVEGKRKRLEEPVTSFAIEPEHAQELLVLV